MQLLNDVNSTATALCMSRSSLYEAVRMRKIAAIKNGKRTLFHRDEIERFAADLPALK
jgi:hypothetical protein